MIYRYAQIRKTKQKRNIRHTVLLKYVLTLSLNFSIFQHNIQDIYNIIRKIIVIYWMLYYAINALEFSNARLYAIIFPFRWIQYNVYS